MKNILAIITLCLAFAFTAVAADSYPFHKIAQAPADETFFTLGNKSNYYNPFEPYVDQHPIMSNGLLGKKKYNSAYAWGVTEIGDEIWFGTMNTGWCGWMSTHLRLPMVEAAFNFVSKKQVCGFTEGRAAQLFIYKVSTGELRAINPEGQIFNGQILQKQIAPNGQYFGDLYSKSKGMSVRAAGNHNGVVFFGALEFEGKNDDRRDYVHLVAFDASNKRFLGSKRFNYDTIRRLNVVTHPDGSQALYAFMGPDTSTQQVGRAKSQLLRWVGPKNDPFSGGDNGDGFDIVGTFPINEGAGGEFLFTVNGDKRRIIVSTWAGVEKSIEINKDPNIPEDSPLLIPQAGALFVTSSMPAAGFTSKNQATFIKIFSNDEFEPDQLVAKGYEMGAMTLWGDYLYWGTMHVGTSAGYKHYVAEYPGISECVIPPSNFDQMTGIPLCTNNSNQDVSFADAALKNSWRASMLFRMNLKNLESIGEENLKTLGDAPNTELLYGEDNMAILDSAPTLNSENVYENVTWRTVPNGKGFVAKYGKQGFGNLLNVYCWTIRVYNNKLYIGTFDLAGGINDYLSTDNYTEHQNLWNEPVVMKKIYDHAKKLEGYNEHFVPGADLFVFENHTDPMKVVTVNGFNNRGNNGVRNQAVINNQLIFGTSTFSSLTDEDDPNGKTEGGYEYFVVTDPDMPVESGGDAKSGGCSIGSNSDIGIVIMIVMLIAVLGINYHRNKPTSITRG